MRVGWIGLGIMGSRMAANLAHAGHELVVHNRTRSVAEAWTASTAGPSPRRPREIRADVVFTMLVDGAAGRGGAARPSRRRDATRFPDAASST